jgi:hypothetical protein
LENRELIGKIGMDHKGSGIINRRNIDKEILRAKNSIEIKNNGRTKTNSRNKLSIRKTYVHTKNKD